MSELTELEWEDGQTVMDRETAQHITILRLKDQLALAVQYIRRHVQGDPSIDDKLMLGFAAGCEDVLERATHNAVLREWELLQELKHTCFPYFNYLNNTGKHSPLFEERAMNIIQRLHNPPERGKGG